MISRENKGGQLKQFLSLPRIGKRTSCNQRLKGGAFRAKSRSCYHSRLTSSKEKVHVSGNTVFIRIPMHTEPTFAQHS